MKAFVKNTKSWPLVTPELGSDAIEFFLYIGLEPDTSWAIKAQKPTGSLHQL